MTGIVGSFILAAMGSASRRGRPIFGDSMIALLAFSMVLLLGVLLSGIAERSILSMAILFLATGFVCGKGILGIVVFQPADRVLGILADAALFSVLFTDGMRLSLDEIKGCWRLPGRALLFGLPLTFVFTAVLCKLLLNFSWLESLLVGAVLSPTDPVFASAIVGRREIPVRLRRLLSLESGVNDGLVLPVVLVLIGVLQHASPSFPALALKVGAGILLGIAVPWLSMRLIVVLRVSVTETYKAFFALAVGLILYSIARLTHANEYLAAFAAGITFASLNNNLRDEFMGLGGQLSELLKLAAVFVFGALISPRFLAQIPPGGYVFAFLALLLVRFAALQTALWGSSLSRKDRLTAGWFGPKGFSSVVYGLLVLGSGIDAAQPLFHVIALVVALSIVLHSSSDVAIAKIYRESAA